MSYECYMNVTFRFCFRSPLKSLKLPVFKGLSTDLGSHSFLHISFYPLYIVGIIVIGFIGMVIKMAVTDAKEETRDIEEASKKKAKE